MDSVGLVFASTGGNKMVRALRSLRRTEPELPVHIIFDTSSKTWNKNKETPTLEWFERQPNVKIECIENKALINGCLNAAVHWMGRLGYDYACLFHDDVVFSPLPEHQGHISKWFEPSVWDFELRKASALTLSYIQAFVPNQREGLLHSPPEEWDKIDLESESFWREFGLGEKWEGLLLEKNAVQYHIVGGETKRPTTRLGPTGQIVPLAVWKALDGFDESEGIFYDIQYPAECITKNMPPVWAIPSVPHLHLHNQSLVADPALGIWSNTEEAFAKRYGKSPGDFWKEIEEL